MKTKNLFLLFALIAALNLIPADRATAQTFTTLHIFSAWPPDEGYSDDGVGLILTNSLKRVPEYKNENHP